MDYGNRALLALCARGGAAPQSEIGRDVGLSADRMGPVVAGLRHNGYVRREFQAGEAVISLTDEGRKWASRRGIPIAERTHPGAATTKVVQPPARTEAAATAEAAPNPPPPESRPRPARRGRPGRVTFQTDDAGYVTHIRGRRIF